MLRRFRDIGEDGVGPSSYMRSGISHRPVIDHTATLMTRGADEGKEATLRNCDSNH